MTIKSRSRFLDGQWAAVFNLFGLDVLNPEELNDFLETLRWVHHCCMNDEDQLGGGVPSYFTNRHRASKALTNPTSDISTMSFEVVDLERS